MFAASSAGPIFKVVGVSTIVGTKKSGDSRVRVDPA
jgi:hypothetical protein